MYLITDWLWPKSFSKTLTYKINLKTGIGALLEIFKNYTYKWSQQVLTDKSLIYAIWLASNPLRYTVQYISIQLLCLYGIRLI